MKRLLICVVLCLLYFQLAAQTRSFNPEKYSTTWNKGSVIFDSGDTLNCDLRYNHAVTNGILQVSDGEHVLTLSPKDVKTFVFYDENKNGLRKFASVAVDESSRQEFFMECLYDDHRFSILHHRTVGIPYDYMNYTRLISKPSPISKKYIFNLSTGELLPLSKENALRLLEKKKTEVTSFIQTNHIKFKKTADYIHLFEYHSSL